MDVSNEQLRHALLSVLAFVLSVTFHEFGHAFVADRLGDGLPRAQGRVTLSPLRHIDLLGTIIVPLMATFASGVPFIAWGKPVQTNPSAMTRRFPRAVNNLLVSLAGPTMNLLLAAAVSVLLVVLARTGHVSRELAASIVQFMVVLNISLMFFNLLPIPPLDGGAILAVILPPSMRGVLPFLQRYGMLVIIILFATGLGSVVMRPASVLAAAWSGMLMGLVPI
jgi:Zn-dependent protease